MISKKTKYGLKALLTLAEEYNLHRPILISELAGKGNIPKKFLELILLDLKRSGLLHSKKGKGGGYFLAKGPAEINLAQVVRTLEGTLSPLPCLSSQSYRRCEECVDEATCRVRMIMGEVREATVKILEQTSLQDMMERAYEPAERMYFI